jgi:excisionase family DNA binding protein
MKTTLEKEDIEAIATEVLNMVKPLLVSNGGAEDTIFDVKGLAEYLRVEESWVYQKIHSGELPHYKMGKYPRFRKSIIDDWLQQREKGNGKNPQSR